MFTRYQPRPLGFLGVESVAGHRLKVYAIRPGNQPFDRGQFAGVWELATTALPQPDAAAGRPGVGFAILHQGELKAAGRVTDLVEKYQCNLERAFLKVVGYEPGL